MKACCSDYEGIKVTVKHVEKECSHHMKGGMSFQIKDCIPENLCIHAYNIAYPYCLTYNKKGKFIWVKEGDGVIAQCPNPQCSVVMKMTPQDEDKVEIRIIDVRGTCEAGHKKDDTFLFSPSSMKICPEIFPALYVPATALYYEETEESTRKNKENKGGKKEINVRTLNEVGEMIVTIQKT